MRPPDGHGHVDAFDEQKGYGTVIGDDGAVVAFHCSRIVDGTRTIPVGAAVRYAVGAGLPGRWEAVRVERTDRGQGAGS